MYAITVIPLHKGLPEETLTYFSKDSIPLGNIVSCPFRKKNIDAIVSEVTDIREIKYDIKNVDFSLRKIEKDKGVSPFSHTFFESCKILKDYTLANTGNIIKNLLPSVILENMDILIKNYKPKIDKEEEEIIKNEKLIFQAPDEDRESFYRTLIREAFARKESVFLCLPTIYEIDRWQNILSRGIEKYVFTIKNTNTKKKIVETYNKILKEDHPIVIISTGIYISTPRTDIKTIIVEHESSESYKQIMRPFVDIRTLCEIYASLQKCKFILGDSFLRPESLSKYENGFYGSVASPIFRLPKISKQIIIDMKKDKDEKGLHKFTILSNEVRSLIEHAIKKDKKVLLFTIRKGLAPLSVCKDCGEQVKCPSCTTPLVLYGDKQVNANKHKRERLFLCNKCGHKENTEIRCIVCNSWNIIPLGIGTEGLTEEIARLYPSLSILQIDKESTPKAKDAEKVIEDFYKNKNTILVANEMVFSYLKEEVDYSVVVSLDGLLSIPSFNIMLKIMHTIEHLQKITKENTLIQTRRMDDKMLSDILSGNILPLYRNDLKEREMYGYPPYKKLIKITFTGDKLQTEEMRTYIDKALEEYDPQIFSVFKSRLKGQYTTNTILKIDPKLWEIQSSGIIKQEENLKEILSSLPHDFIINIDPEDLL